VRVETTLLVFIIFASSQAWAEQQDDPLPSDSMLDFLGQWEKVDGKWVDPTEIQDMTMLEYDKLKGKHNEK